MCLVRSIRSPRLKKKHWFIFIGDLCFTRSQVASARESRATSSNATRSTQDSQRARRCESNASVVREFNIRNSPSPPPPLKRNCAAQNVRQVASVLVLCLQPSERLLFVCPVCRSRILVPSATRHVLSRGFVLMYLPRLSCMSSSFPTGAGKSLQMRCCGWRQNKSDLSCRGCCSSWLEYPVVFQQRQVHRQVHNIGQPHCCRHFFFSVSRLEPCGVVAAEAKP